MPPPQMTILNAPIRDACIARRERTNTPAQALFLLNESEYTKAARTSREEVARLGRDRADRVPWDRSWPTRPITTRLPDDKERGIFVDLLEKLIPYYEKNPKLAEELCAGLAVEPAEKRAQLAA